MIELVVTVAPPWRILSNVDGYVHMYDDYIILRALPVRCKLSTSYNYVCVLNRLASNIFAKWYYICMTEYGFLKEYVLTK